MSTISRALNYRCANDCVMSGCPGHEGVLQYQSTSDAYLFNMNGRIMDFERGELDAMLTLLRRLNRIDAAGQSNG